MNRRGVLAVGVAVVAGSVFVFALDDSPADCGLGTGGVVTLNETSRHVETPREARSLVTATLTDPTDKTRWAITANVSD